MGYDDPERSRPSRHRRSPDVGRKEDGEASEADNEPSAPPGDPWIDRSGAPTARRHTQPDHYQSQQAADRVTLPQPGRKSLPTPGGDAIGLPMPGTGGPRRNQRQRQGPTPDLADTQPDDRSDGRPPVRRRGRAAGGLRGPFPVLWRRSVAAIVPLICSNTHEFGYSFA